MIVSQFELVYKPQSPFGPADVVLQGYFLKITNLEDTDLRFRLTFTTSSVSDADRSLFQNAVVLIDTPDQNNAGPFQLLGELTSKTFTLRPTVLVPAHGTALVAMFPSDPFPPNSVPAKSANFECRGFVTLTLPALRFAAQARGPVEVLLSAQNRGVYLDQTTEVPKGQTQGNVTLSSGQSLNKIEPEQPLPLVFSDLDLNPVIDDDLFTPQTLIEMLTMMGAQDPDLRKLNAALKERGSDLALEKRKK